MRNLDPIRLKESYSDLLGGISPEKRKDLWAAAHTLYPEVADHLWNHFAQIEEGDGFDQARDRIGGAMFMFLALVNATMDKPILARSSTNLPGSFPNFGNLPSLR
jgi:hypothetical protein